MKRIRWIVGTALLLLAGIAGLASSFEANELQTTPETFAFQSVCGQSPGVSVESDIVTITGITEPVSISVINGEYSINGGPFTAEVGTVAYGQTVAVRHTSANADDASTSTILSVGGRSASFTSSTGPCLRGTN
jgi:hypothetical protein